MIISGTGYDDHVTGVGRASKLNGPDLNSRIGSYGNRTIVDEFGAPMTTRIDHLADYDGALYQSYFATLTDRARTSGIGTVYWAGLKTGDNYSLKARNGSGLSNNNSSGVAQVRWGWGC